MLDNNRYWEIGLIGLDVKAVRTQPTSIDRQKMDALIKERNYEELDWLILKSLMG